MPSEIEQYLEKLNKAIEELNRQQAEILAKRLSAAFVFGFNAAEKIKSSSSDRSAEISDLQRRAIKKLSAEQLGYLVEFNHALGLQLQNKVRELIAEGRGYADIRQEMKPFIQEVFGPDGTVTIDRTGQTREIIQVLSDGSLRRAEKTITQPYSASLETYSDMLSRTATHAAYSRGRAEGYKSRGMKKWRYVAVQDERVRASHLALHGRIFEVDSDEGAMALEVLSEPHCRCRQIPFFDDPKLDTPESVYEAQKEKFGLEFKNGEWMFAE